VPDITAVVLASDSSQATQAVRALITDSVAPRTVLILGCDAEEFQDPTCTGLPEVPATVDGLCSLLERIDSSWVAVVGPTCVPQAGWLAALCSAISSVPEAACAGGRVFATHRARTVAAWLEPGASVAHVSWHGSVRGHFEDLPAQPIASRAEFADGRSMLIAAALLRACCGVSPGVSPSGLGLVAGSEARRHAMCCAYTSSAVVVEADDRGFEDIRLATARCLGHDAIVSLLGPRRSLAQKAAGLGCLLVGQMASPGLLLAPAYLLRHGRRTKWEAAAAGRLSALRSLWAQGRGVRSADR
jgi:hypothetical protein